MSFSPSRLDALRQRTIWTLVAGVAIGSTGHIAAVTVGTIVAGELAGTAALAGLPAASVVLGSAMGSALLSILMARRGRRAGLSLGYTISVAGAIVATGRGDHRVAADPGPRHPVDRVRQQLQPAVALCRRRPRAARTPSLHARARRLGSDRRRGRRPEPRGVLRGSRREPRAARAHRAVSRADGVRRRGRRVVLRDAPTRPVRARRHHGRTDRAAAMERHLALRSSCDARPSSRRSRRWSSARW